MEKPEKPKRWASAKGAAPIAPAGPSPMPAGLRELEPGSTGRGRGSLGLAAAYAAGAANAFLQRYHADLARLAERADLPAEARWFDSHCHLESILQRTWRGGGKPQVANNEPEVTLPELVALWPPGLDGCVANFVFRKESKPGFTPEWEWIARHLSHFEEGSPISSKLWFTIGLHPHNAAGWDAAAEKTVRDFAAHPKCVGLGECGLDFFKHDPSEEEVQLTAFRAQAKLAVELGKALVVHARLVTRENEIRFLRELKQLVPQNHPIHIHCFGDSLEHAKELIDHYPRLRIGFTGAITFSDPPGSKGRQKGRGKHKGNELKKGQEHCRELIQCLPLERLLIETDGPYMCPEPFRGQTAHPGHVHRVAERIAEWQNVSLGAVMAATWQSTVEVYGLTRL
ncbi:TATDN2 [Symbiodinium natans]|uniref:TATDN2 protein n=1 Tax=Symbiodinium natans TaxID=878477 RepID=A0A812NZ75_9DINO|nr:TATDN2 [Symbiodinium natans]